MRQFLHRGVLLFVNAASRSVRLAWDVVQLGFRLHLTYD